MWRNNSFEYIIELWQQDKRTVIFVTHDIEECLLIAEKIFVLSKFPAKVTYEGQINIPRQERDLEDSRINETGQKINQVFFE